MTHGYVATKADHCVRSTGRPGCVVCTGHVGNERTSFCQEASETYCFHTLLLSRLPCIYRFSLYAIPHASSSHEASSRRFPNGASRHEALSAKLSKPTADKVAVNEKNDAVGLVAMTQQFGCQC